LPHGCSGDTTRSEHGISGLEKMHWDCASSWLREKLKQEQAMRPKHQISRLPIFAMTLFFAANLESAHGEQLRHDPSITVVLKQKAIKPSESQRLAAKPSDEVSKVGCVLSVNRAISELEEELQIALKDRNQFSDLEYQCKSFVLSATPATTVVEERSYFQSKRVAVFFYYTGTDEIIFTTTSGAQIFLGCEQRNFEEKVLYSMTKRCESQPTEACLNPNFLERVRTLGATRYIRLVNANEVCGLGQPVEQPDKDSKTSRTLNSP
jgi:hypothetical protein